MLKNAGFFIIDKNDRILILREHNNLWGSPGGHIEEFDSDAKEAAKRELFEETGIEYSKLKILKERYWTWKKTTRIYVIRVEKIPKVKLSEEHTKYKKIELEKLEKYNYRYSFAATLRKNLNILN